MRWAVVARADIPHARKEAFRLRDHLLGRGQDVLLERDLAKALLTEPATARAVVPRTRAKADGKAKPTAGRSRARPARAAEPTGAAGNGMAGYTLAELDRRADLFLTVGGDGTILWTQSGTEKPVFAVNAGAIGFLTEVEPPLATEAIDRIIAGNYDIDERHKLAAWLDGRMLPDATNEVTVQTSRIAKLIHFRVTVDDETVDTLRGDGVILSTPTGSTGYAMSVGGPLVHPRVGGLVLAPIAPFRLAARPWVIPVDSRIEITLLERDSARGRSQPARVVIDGQHGFGVSSGQTVRIEQSPRKARFVRLGSGFYERVRSKLTR